MNIADLIIIGIIVLFAAVGLSRGMVRSILKIGSFFISVFVAVKYHPVVADFLKSKPIFTSLKDTISTHILAKNPETSLENAAQVEGATRSIVDGLSLPEFIKDMLSSDTSSGLLNYQELVESVSEEIAGFIISILSLIALFIAVRLVLILVRLLLGSITRLPVIKQLDKVGGLILGAFEGFLMVYVLLALLTLFASSDWFVPVHDAISRSMIAGHLYQNNFLMKFVMP